MKYTERLNTIFYVLENIRKINKKIIQKKILPTFLWMKE